MCVAHEQFCRLTKTLQSRPDRTIPTRVPYLTAHSNSAKTGEFRLAGLFLIELKISFARGMSTRHTNIRAPDVIESAAGTSQQLGAQFSSLSLSRTDMVAKKKAIVVVVVVVVGYFLFSKLYGACCR